MKVDNQVFRNWQKDPITILMMDYLRQCKEWEQESMLNSSLILGENGLKHYAKMAGVIETIDKISNLELSDLVEQEDDKEKVTSD